MIRRTSIFQAAFPAALLVTLVACEAKKSSNPLSPSVAGPIAGVEISVPKLLEPAQGFKFKENQQPIKLLIENSSTTGVRPISYVFEVASDADFNTKVFARSGVAPGEGGRTSVQLDTLELGRPYYWRARAEDGANNSTFATAGFEVLPKAVLMAPASVSPINNEQVAGNRPTLQIGNSQSNSAVGPVTYFFVVARDQAFTQVVAYADVSESGDTRWTVDRDLEHNATHFWRARATDGDVYSEWSITQAFRTADAPKPSPSPSPSPGPAPGGPCNASSAEQIVSCERAKFRGRMSHGQMFQFMRATAQSLNRNHISGGPYGILRKESGTNCNGYSCDVLCAGQGSSQRQWDILGDIDRAQTPGWSGPKRVPHIRVDACEIQ
ncbi:MAG: hypothetical protein ACRD15_09080 [Vicinamibacterales bacterium]